MLSLSSTQPTKVSWPRNEKLNAMHLSQDRRCSCTQHFDWGMAQSYHLEGMQLHVLNIQISEVRRLFILCETLFSPMWCSTLPCHLHGIRQDVFHLKMLFVHLYFHMLVQGLLQMLILPDCAQSILVSLHWTFNTLVLIHVNLPR